jgi:folate-binding protein YgfZ
LQHDSAAVAEPLALLGDEAGLLKLSWWFGRELCLAAPTDNPADTQYQAASDEEWRFLDITAGFPWFEAEQSELYIPQMLNIDGLGGVSFNKGCYTGQEIIARTHYLGAAKRHLYIAECAEEVQVSEQSLAVIDAATRQSLGAVLLTQSFFQQSRLLLVLSGDDLGSRQLLLDDGKQTAIKISAT